MLKLTAIISLVLIGSTMWAASLSCDSCGSECASACGTRHFRSCCFNYLRRKRGPDGLKFLTSTHEFKMPEKDLNAADYRQLLTDKSKHPVFVLENLPEWYNYIANEYRPYANDDTIENRLVDV